MQTEEIFYRYVDTVVEERRDRAQDWPQIEAAIQALHPDDIEHQAKILALLIGLRAGERQKDSLTRETSRQAILADLRFAKGTENRSNIRRRARSLARKRADQIQSKLIFGFFLERGQNTVSKSDLNTLLEAIECVWHLDPADRQTKLSTLYGQFRSRVNRLKRDGGSGVEGDALALFENVFGIVINYIY